MIETSKDVLYLTIALAVLIVTVFLVWIMYYLAMILKQSKEIVSEVRKKVEAFGEILNNIKEKVATSATVLTALGKGVADLIGLFKEKKESKRAREEKSAPEEKAKKKKK